MGRLSTATPNNKSSSSIVKLDDINAPAVNNANNRNSFMLEAKGDRKLKRMGIMTALAIGVHNFPEGLATFVATLDDPAVGIALAVAIGVHNIPEGISVAIPVYYSTDNRCTAFWWAMLSGVTEPLGALLGYLVLMAYLGPLIYGILFGFVGGNTFKIIILFYLLYLHFPRYR